MSATALDPKDHFDKFEPEAYFDTLYRNAEGRPGIRKALTNLPKVIQYLPENVGNVLDLGAGPTVHFPIAIRNKATAIYTSDYAAKNREVLLDWILERNSYNWNSVCSIISQAENITADTHKLQAEARKKFKGVLDVNVLDKNVIQGVHWKANDVKEIPSKYGVVAAEFILESATETVESFHEAMKNAVSLVEKGGYLLYGGRLFHDSYSFGNTTFRCHKIELDHIVEGLKKAGMGTQEEDGFHMIFEDYICLLVSKKLVD